MHIDGQPLDEPYLPTETPTGPAPESETSFAVPRGHVFVLGDNRSVPYDSRSHGPVHIDDVIANSIRVFSEADQDDYMTDWAGYPVFVVTTDVAAGTLFADVVTAGTIAERETRQLPTTAVTNLGNESGIAQRHIAANSILIADMFE